MEVQLKRPTPGNASPAPYEMSSQVVGDGKFPDLLKRHLTVMVSCKGVKGMSLIVEGNVVRFAETNGSDPKQQWIKVEDPLRNAFALVNLATWQAIQIPTAAKQPVRLALYKPNDPSLLWTATDTEDGTDDGYSIIREFVHTDLVLDAVHNGLQVVVSNYSGSDNQLWKFEHKRKA